MNPSIFINYRRDDAGAEAMLVLKDLIARFGEANVFMDVTSIDPGEKWPLKLEQALMQATAVVCVIGPDWLRVSDAWGRRRIDLDGDWVRTELETALKSAKKLIPVFVKGAVALPKTALPVSIQDLADLEGIISIRHDHWNHDIKLLLAALAATESPQGLMMEPSNPYPVSKLLPPDRLPDDRREQILQYELPQWKWVVSHLQLPEKPKVRREEFFRELKFKTFGQVIAFMEEVAAGCEIANHHPRWENIYKTLRVYLSTWDGGLHTVSDRDVQLARYFDRAYAEFPGRDEDAPNLGQTPTVPVTN